MAVKIVIWPAIPLIGLLLVAAACGGGSSGGDPEQLLARMVLRLDDLPAGYSEDPGEYSENEDIALGDEEELARLEAQGRILGYDTAFNRGDVSEQEAPFVGVDSAVSLYEDAGGAGESWDQAAEEARSTDWEASLGFGETKVEEVDREIADETLWLRVTGLVELGEEQTPVLVMDDQIILRQGRARGYLRVFSAMEGSGDRSALIDEVASLAERQLQRMNEAVGD